MSRRLEEMKRHPLEVLGDLRFFHRHLSRKDTKDVLEQNGDFILRKSKSGVEEKVVASVLWRNEIRHFPIQKSEGKYCFETRSFRTVRELVQWHQSTHCPVTDQSGAILKVAKPLLEWEILETEVILDNKKSLYQGRHAEICEGRLFLRNGAERKIAIKAILTEEDSNKNDFEEAREMMLHEARSLREVGLHPNIMNCFGITISSRNTMMAIDLMSGDLARRLSEKPQLSIDCKMKLLKHAINALAYVHGHGLVHRSVCAKNFLIAKTQTDGTYTLKLTGFDSCEKLDSSGSFTDPKVRLVNVRFSAPESLATKVWTKASDMWSYGVLEYEVFHDGATPYASELAKVPEPQQARVLLKALQDGTRLVPPPLTPDAVKSFWSRCFHVDPKDRPNDKEVIEILTVATNARS